MSDKKTNLNDFFKKEGNKKKPATQPQQKGDSKQVQVDSDK
jgi:hypothetical protein